MDPSRIATIAIIKAENARVCYGTRGKNGAVFITTEKAGK
jgi:hypothetical protein